LVLLVDLWHHRILTLNVLLLVKSLPQIVVLLDQLVHLLKLAQVLVILILVLLLIFWHLQFKWLSHHLVLAILTLDTILILQNRLVEV